MKTHEAIHLWSEWLEDTLAPSTAVSQIAKLEAWSNNLEIRSRSISDMAKWKEINRYLKAKSAGSIRYDTLKQHIAAFRSFFKFLHAAGYLPNDPGPLIKVRPQIMSIPQLEENPRVPFNHGEYGKILMYVVMQMNSEKGQQKTRWWAQFWRVSIPLAYWCGIRLMDCCCLTLDNFRDDGMLFWTKKRNKRVFLPFSDPLIGHQHLLGTADFVKQMHNNGTPRPSLMPGPSPYVFPEMRERIDSRGRNNFSTRFKRILDKLNIQDKSFHCFRHSFATRHGLEEGKTFEDVAVLMGHSDTKTTKGYYHG